MTVSELEIFLSVNYEELRDIYLNRPNIPGIAPGNLLVPDTEYLEFSQFVVPMIRSAIKDYHVDEIIMPTDDLARVIAIYPNDVKEIREKLNEHPYFSVLDGIGTKVE